MNGPVYRRPAHVAVVASSDLPATSADRIYLAHLDDAFIAVLEDTAALIWTVVEGPSDRLVGRVAAASGRAAAEIASDVEQFVDDLLRRGLLEQVAR